MYLYGACGSTSAAPRFEVSVGSSIALISASGDRALLQAKGRWQLRLDLLVDIRIADFDFNGNNLKLRCTNLYFKSLFYLHDYFKTTTNSNLKA